MRGTDTKQSSMLALMSPESVVPTKHPLRRVKVLADAVLTKLSPTFDAMYSAIGRPSIAPERLLKSMVLMALYSVRSERLLCEQLGYNLLFRWFLDMDMVEPAPDHSTFSRNRERLLEHDVAGEFFRAVVEQARSEKLMSDEHFTVDGTLIEAMASLKSFRPKNDKDDGKGPPEDGNRWVDFHGEKRSNETHESKTDPEAKLMRKGLGKEAKLSYSAHALMDNRNGLLVDLRVGDRHFLFDGLKRLLHPILSIIGVEPRSQRLAQRAEFALVPDILDAAQRFSCQFGLQFLDSDGLLFGGLARTERQPGGGFACRQNIRVLQRLHSG